MLATIGWTEGLMIAGILALLFGARKLPELGKSLGEGIREFRKSSRVLVEDDEKSQEQTE
ncbi:MAG TPA: twin-arginine translocase TatA/TatE family subunit [Armatimonadota bacterium]|nr:twin-arginine translocase TatA/TatE family subunit [Armatimonadota bacterium]HOP80548.1 twin-arginine translocase TatA/TatE family subunit [Armatimonadota bacterium]HPP75763.1 twin-arginine translocase TatA/TatE family subunit [Armatimonadota bacterium]